MKPRLPTSVIPAKAQYCPGKVESPQTTEPVRAEVSKPRLAIARGHAHLLPFRLSLSKPTCSRGRLPRAVLAQGLRQAQPEREVGCIEFHAIAKRGFDTPKAYPALSLSKGQPERALWSATTKLSLHSPVQAISSMLTRDWRWR